MSHYKVLYLVERGRDLKPQLEVAGYKLFYMTDLSDKAAKALQEELGPTTIDSLRVVEGIPCIAVDVQAGDDNDALRIAHRYASQVIQPFCLIEDEGPEISLSLSRPPAILPNALLANMDENPEAADFGYYVPNIVG